jgi:hypothetical protein
MALSGCASHSAAPAEAPEPVERRSGQGSESKNHPQVAVVGNFSWGNESKHVVIDGRFVWHTDPSPVLQAFRMAAQSVANPCLWGAANDQIYFTNRQLAFDSRSQGVWPATAAIQWTVTWRDEDYLQKELALAWRNTTHAPFQNTGFFDKGATAQIPVKPGMWDDPQVSGTQWEFWLCVSDDMGEYPGRVFTGEFDIRMELVKGEFTDPES